MPEKYTEADSARAGRTQPVRRLPRSCLTQCEDESRNFHADYLSPAFDRDRIAALMDRLKIEEDRAAGSACWSTVGDNEEHHAFIPAAELIDVRAAGSSSSRARTGCSPS